MKTYLKSTKIVIKESYDDLTKVEKGIADYFLSGQHLADLSSKHIAEVLYVSEASLSRFAKKLGYSGYREFAFAYGQSMKENEHLDQLTQLSIHRYQSILERTVSIVDNQQMIRVAKMLDEHPRVFVYGIGSSGLVAQEMRYRFMRVGLDIDCFTDDSVISLNISRVKEGSLVIGISISGNTAEVISGLKKCKSKGAQTILLTAHIRKDHYRFCDEVIRIASIKNLTASHIISPQLPALVVVDVLYTHYLDFNHEYKMGMLKETLDQIDYDFEK